MRISGAGHRVENHAHRLGEFLNLGRREMALLCVLMLRGPQTVGELRGRTERMHDFADLEEVERVLSSLETATPHPLVARMPRGRWVQLLGGPVDDSDVVPVPVVVSGREALEARVTALEREVQAIRLELEKFRQQFE
jgi:uncharacterized protein YceH (UPF0502 family)